MIKAIKSIIGGKKEKELKRYILHIDRIYPDWHSKAGQFTHFGSKVTGRTVVPKIHEFVFDYERWLEAEAEINAGDAKMTICYREIRGADVYDTRICSYEKIKVQVARFGSSIEDGLILNNRIISVAEIAQNQGLTESDFIEWYKFNENERVGILQFTSFEY
ncbi:MAG: hypothetical protein E6767_11855 [Dysgonomonas sp.]|nr:hypothetical protein [Dysgonomonas sp.]